MGFFLYLATILSKLKDNYNNKYNNNKMDKNKNSFKTRILTRLSVLYTAFIALPTFIIVMLIGCLLVSQILIFALIASVETNFSFQQGGGDATVGDGQLLSSGGEVNFTEEQLAAVGGALTDEEKNFYRLGIAINRAAQGYGGVRYLDAMSPKLNTVFVMGVSSIETSMKFYKDGKDRNILEIPSDWEINDSPPGYGFMGLSPSTYSLGVMTAQQKTDMMQAFTPKEQAKYDINYAPWAVYFTMKHLDSKQSAMLLHLPKVEKVFKEWDLDFTGENKEIVQHLMLQAAYHGWYTIIGDPEIEAYANFWAMMLHVTGDNNQIRSFSKWTLTNPADSYSESTFRKTMLGTNMDWKTAGQQSTPKGLTGVGTKIALNGTQLDVPVWRFIYEKYGTSHPAQWKKVWSVMNTFGVKYGGYGDRQLNFHYGFNSYLQGNRIMNQIYTKIAPLLQQSTGGSGGAGNSGGGQVAMKGTFKHEKGVLQLKQITHKGTVKSTEDFLNGYYASNNKSLFNKLRPLVGVSDYIVNANNHARVKGLPYNRYGTPFHTQNPYKVEEYQKTGYSTGGETFQNAGCMVYSMSHVLSSYTGLNINPPETSLYLHALGGLASDMSYDTQHAAIIKAITGKEGKYVSASNKASYWAAAKEHLDAKRGAVIYRLGPKYAGGPAYRNHYVVLLNSHDIDGRKMYSMYSSSSLGDTTTLHLGDDLMNNPGSNKYATLVFE